MPRKGEPTRITEQQKQFVLEFLKLRKSNQTQAAVNAGYSIKTAASQSSQLLKNPKVKEFLDEQESKLYDDLRQEFLFDALEARQVMYDIMSDGNAKDSDRLSAAKDFLDRAGFKATEKVSVSANGDSLNKLANIMEQLKK